MLKKCVYLLLSFMVGVAGNLIAGWIQQDVWLNAFTPIRIVVTVILVCLALLLIACFERRGSLPQRQRDSSGVVERQKVELVKEHEEARTEAIRNIVNALDNYEKAVLREFFIQKRNAIMVHEDNVAVVSLLRKGIIHTIGEGKYLLEVGWVCPVSLSPTAEAIIKGSSLQVLGFPPGAPTPEQAREIQRARPGFAVDIEAFRPQ
jgi:hypothetical protein